MKVKEQNKNQPERGELKRKCHPERSEGSQKQRISEIKQKISEAKNLRKETGWESIMYAYLQIKTTK